MGQRFRTDVSFLLNNRKFYGYFCIKKKMFVLSDFENILPGEECNRKGIILGISNNKQKSLSNILALEK